MSKKLLSMLLVLSMIFTMLPIPAMAKEANITIGTRVEIIAFAPLEETEKSVMTGTSFEDLELPQYLTATVRTTPASAIQADAIQQTVADKVYSSEWEESMIDIPVTWTSVPEYDMDSEGVYVFTPVIEGYTVSDDLSEIKVTVESVRMMKGLFSPMSATEYDLWVGGVRVTSTNKDDINGTGITGTIIYDSESNTLTLNGASITANYSNENGTYGIYALQALNIVLEGTNSVTAVSANEKESIAIRVANNPLTISGDGSLTAKGGSVTGITNFASCGISAGNLTINSGTVVANAGTVPFNLSSGISSPGTLAFNGGTITATGNNQAIRNNAPDLNGYANVQISANTTASGTGTAVITPTQLSSNLSTYKYLKFEPYVAEIGGTGYTTLQAAVDEVADGDTIQLLDNINLTGNVTIASGDSRSFTLELNGKTLDSGNNNAITHNGSGTLKITDNNGGLGKVTSVYTNSNGTILLKGGSLDVAGGTVENTNIYMSCTAIYNYGSGNVSVSDGTVSAGGGAAIYNHSSGNVSVSNGTVKANTGNAIRNISTGNVEVSGGTVESAGYTITNSSTGRVSVSGGKVKNTGTGFAIWNQSTGKVTISDTAKVTSANTISTWGTIYLSGGTADDTILEIKGGTIENTAAGNGIYNNAAGKIVIPSGSPVIKGGNMAMNKAPDLTGYDNVQISASTTDAEGGGASVIEEAALISDITTYKYLKFEPAYTIRGTIKGSDTNRGIAGAAVQLKKGSSNIGISVLTGSNGTYTISNVPADTYSIEVSAGGYDSGTISSVVVSNANVTGKDLTLTKTVAIHSITATTGTGGSISPNGSVTVNNGASQAFTITPDNNYSIADVKVDNVSQGKITSYTFNNVTANHTISATFSYTGGSGSGSGGRRSSDNDSSSGSSGSSADSSSLVIITPPAPDKPDSPTQGEIKVDGKVDENGNATVNITDKNVTDVFDKALADAKKNGNEQNGITLVLHVSTGGKTFSNVTVNLPKTVQDIIISKRIVNTIVVVDNPDIKISMDLATVEEINRQANSDVNVTAARTDSGKLTGDAKRAIGSRPVFDLKVNYDSGKQVQSFGAGSVSVTIPYILGASEKAENVCAVYIDGNGKVHWLVSSVYDSVEKVLRFATSHFSTYGIGYKQTNTAFTDIASHWAKEDIEFVVSRGLFSGTSATTFSPNTAMTRGMFVIALGRLANADASGYKQSSFTDVKSAAYYMGYIEWASKNSIVNGTGNGKFAPDQSITREQMAVIMQNYAKVIGFTLPKVHGQNIFADSAKISAYAKDAVEQMQMAGVISGKNGNLFDPQGTATRAEVSAVLRRFVELAISSDTMQGWARM